ncbi:MAG: SirB1 family protein [Herpetosiphon sp.]
MEHIARWAFRRVIQRPDHQIDVVEAALRVAEEDLDLVDLQPTRDLIHDLAMRVLKTVGPPHSSLDYAEQLVRYLHASEGFVGNMVHYDDPSNSYLPIVCERRRGLPITLSLVLLALAAPLGIPLEAASLPSHFMVRWRLPDGTLFLDLFFGQVLDGRSCRAFLEVQSGTSLPDPDIFPLATHRDVLVRLLTNLKESYVRRSKFAMALAATERILLLQPQSLENLRDRGYLRIRTGDLHRGLFDLERYVEHEPDAANQYLLRKQAQATAERLQTRN